jgi:hypothetical protein
MRKMQSRSIVGLAVLLTAALSASTIAYAETTTETRVVNGLAQGDQFDPDNPPVNLDSGWYAQYLGTGAVEIGSAYGAPQGFGTDAVMFDTPDEGDRAYLTAQSYQPSSPFEPAFPGYIRTTPDLHLSFWLYLDEGSTAGPVIEQWYAHWATHSIITFDPIANGYDREGEWMYVDATADDAMWTVRGRNDTEQVEMTWPDLIERYRSSDGTYAAFDYDHLTFLQDAPGAASAIDGITVENGTISTWDEDNTRIDTLWSLVTDFELAPAHGRPLLDDCKNDGWQQHRAGPFRNQGQCIAAIVANQ